MTDTPNDPFGQQEPADAGPYRILTEDVESSNIKALGYDAGRRVLAVVFKPRTEGAEPDIFHYSDVSLGEALAFYTAESKGRFYTQHVKGKKSGLKMTGAFCPKCGNGPGYLGERCDDCGCATYQHKPREVER